MLRQLTIRNYALIRHLEMEPSEKLTVITGETGAGKSIMLGAAGLLLGNRADTRTLWNDQEKCVTEGVFSVREYPIQELFEAHDIDFQEPAILRREISPGGKSRAFINDTPVTLDVMRAIGTRLMDVHSQHETLDLGTRAFQLSLIDSFADTGKMLEEYARHWQTLSGARKMYESRKQASEKLKSEYDFIRFQYDELKKAAFEAGEQERLESQLRIAEHSEDIKTRLSRFIGISSQNELSLQQLLTESLAQLQPLRSYAPVYESLVKRLESLRIELKDITGEIEHEEEQVDVDPAKRQSIQQRLDTLYGLLKKHHAADVGALLAKTAALEEQVNQTKNIDSDLKDLQEAFDRAQQKVQTLAAKLTKARSQSFDALSKELVTQLKGLGIPDASIKITSATVAPGPTGADEVDILFSANKGVAPKPLAEVASGGEFSRLMFCVKYVMAEKTALPTLILDEIDTGISGEIAIQLGKMMKKMATRHQLITITHLPQIAARGDVHYLVYKDNSADKTVSGIQQLDDKQRVAEIAKMLGGAKPSAAAVENAKELMKL